MKKTMRTYTVLVLCTAGLLIAAGCTRNAAPPSPPTTAASAGQAPADATVAADGYVGNAACVDCHPREFQDHRASNHANTLRLMNASSLGKLAPPQGRLPDSAQVVKVSGEAYYLDSDPPEGFAQKLDYAFGAGKHGMTYVGLQSDRRLLEIRASFFPAERKWHTTPGLENIPADTTGQYFSEENSRRCFGCHVVTLPPRSLTPDPRFLGVGCEACHGPAGAHVAAMKAVKTGGSTAGLHIDRIGTWGGTRVSELCAHCHRTAPPPTPMQALLSTNPRFEPNDLVLSRCFQESNDTLTCITCHDPHRNTPHDLRAQEAVCLSCHGTANRSVRTDSRSRAVTVVKGKVCPVNSRTGCIGCHMPTRKLLPTSLIRSAIPDHYIRIYSRAKRSSDAS